MLKRLWEVVATLLTLTRDLQQYRQEQKELRNEVRDLTILIHSLLQDNKHTKEQIAQRHQSLLVELENRLLKYEKALPPAKASKKSAKKGSKK